jgi:predicted DNA-binding transcriptional regulator YafY
VLAKVTLALPREKREFVEATALFAPAFHIDPTHGERLEQVRRAIAARLRLELQYGDVASRLSQRVIWPLALYFFGGTWLIGAWCELRGDFRSFRLDRIIAMATAGHYPEQTGRRLPDFVRTVQRNSRPR